MAGSFDIFRRNQRTALAALAILAMLAFFVLPPFLQMGSGVTSSDPVAATWTGGELRESTLERAVGMRAVVNRFLVESAAAAGRDPSRIGVLPEDELSVVRTLLLAKEAEANGIVVSDSAVNDFIGQWTNNLVRQEQLDEIIGRMRMGPMGVSQYDLFEALRTELAAQSMRLLFQTGFSGDPPGWRWDYFRRLEQSAVVEVVPVVAESLAAQVPAPSEATLQAFFERYKNDLPEARSVNPGFKEPHRATYQYLVAKQETFEAEAAKTVTDEQIKEFYDKNKTTLFRAKPAAEKPAADPAKPAETTPADEKKPAPAKPASVEEKPADPKPADPKPAEPKPAEPKPAEPKPAEPKPAPESGSDAARAGRIVTVAFRKPGDAPDSASGEAVPSGGDVKASEAPKASATPNASDAAKPAAGEPSKPVTASDKPAVQAADGEAPKTAAEPPSKDAEKKDAEKKDAAAAGKTPATPADKPAEEPVQVEPLDAVKDDIRKRLARQAADARIDAVFSAVSGDLGRYAEDYALWQAKKIAGAAAPRPPDIEAIAKKQGLEAGAGGPMTADAAVAAGGIGGSYELVPDATSRFGIRQQRWLDMIFGQGAPTLRPVTSRDVDGNRYLSWKTEDQPEFTPTFAAVKQGVEQAWRIVEARGLARARAEAIAAAAKDKDLKAAAAAKAEGKEGPEVVRAGPFTWLTQGTIPLGTPPTLSQPEGISMPGEEFMKAVFALAPGETAVAFNEPQTVCYVIKLVSLEPAEDKLRDRFVAERNDQRRLAMVAQREFSDAMDTWVEGLESRYALSWKREPRGR